MIQINGARICQAMVELEIGIREMCIRARVDHRTLKKIVDEGKMVRIDSLSRVCKTLNIPVQEVIINGPPLQEKGESELLHQGREPSDVTQDQPQGLRRPTVIRLHTKAAGNL